MTEKQELDRRSFLKASIVAGGALLLGFNLPTKSRAEERFNSAADLQQNGFQPNSFLRIAKDGKVTVVVGQAEMGQGVLTSLPMIVAEELEVDWKNVGFESGPADKAFINPMLGSQITGGSSSVKAFFEPLRKSAATVREMLISAAANTWNVAPETCIAESGKVVHTTSKRSIAYGDLLEKAATLTPNANPKLKDPKNFKIIGKNMPRLDTPSKVNGTGIFGIDVRVEGMLTATILRSPVFEGKVKSFDDAAAKMVKGVRAVVPLGYGVGVVADNYWAAKKGRDALKVEWDGGKFANVSSESIYQTYAAAANNEKGLSAKKVGDVNAVKSSAAKTVEAVYFAPYLSHATMEPMNFTADVRADGCELWGGIQGQLIIQKVVAQTLSLAPEKVKVNTTLLGGGFGRRIGLDYVLDAVLLSKTIGKPVKVVWTREDDMQHDFYRPATYNKMSAGIDGSGKPVFWEHRVVNPSIMAPIAPVIFGFALPETQVDDSSVEGASTLPYDFPNLQVDWIRKDTGIPVGFWRSVGSSHTAFSTECFLDEVAFAAKKDPYEFRRSLLEKHPRHKGALELAATKAGWGKPLAKGVFQGIAVHESFGSYVAQVAEVSVGADGNVKVHRVVCAVDCGQVVNPDTVVAQMEGGIIFGLTAALYGEITIKDGRVQQRNFYDYKMLRMNETPRIEVYIVPSTEKHGGVGEPGTPPIAPAVVNAIFAATGKRIRSLPIRAEELKKA
ncbi:MAG TPA: xanthine dehydrogenase family protein molybdopterin-binding subunit [Pyrinomonadaceae bacterium]|nr:xanthine dehydrogenase family protein molybdopterin-binding subunit [Pyrinomonadaceae bacterium]